MWSGALLGAVGFEILKQLSTLLIRSTQSNPAFQVFGLALILLVWINYFSRVILYAAAWAWTHPLAREQRVAEPAAPVEGPRSPSVDEAAEASDDAGGRSRKGAFAAGAAIGAAATAAAVPAGVSRAERHLETSRCPAAPPGAGAAGHRGLLAPTCPR